MVQKTIKAIIKEAVRSLWDVDIPEVHLEYPQNPAHGDLAANIALTSSQLLKHSPMVIAKQLVAEIAPKLPFLEKIEVASPGFINMTLKKDFLLKELGNILEQRDAYGSSAIGRGKGVLLEHTSPNTNKALHLAHVKNNVLGMSVANILAFLGYEVVLACLYNDRGIHICKAMWGYLRRGGRSEKLKANNKTLGWRAALDFWFDHQKDWLTPKEVGRKGDHFVEDFYVVGVKAERKAKKDKEEMREMLRAWEAKEEKIHALWKKLLGWVYAGFEETFKRLGSRHDVCWFESDLYERGKKMVLAAVEKGIFRRLPDGAILSNLGEFNLPDTIVVRADGTTMYHTQDIYLTKLKRERYPGRLYIWDVGPEQTLYLKQLFAMCRQLGMGSLADFFHLTYGFVFLKGGAKMSSRAGTVVRADEVLDLLRKKAREILAGSSLGENYTAAEKEEIAAAVSGGALKYGMLKQARLTATYFDIEESLSFEGHSGPYLQYTAARAQSVLRKAGEWPEEGDSKFGFVPMPEEMAILRFLYRFPAMVEKAGEAYAPNFVCEYLFDLAQKFNLFYERVPILKAGERERVFRLRLTAAVAVVLRNGLGLLGIKALERM